MPWNQNFPVEFGQNHGPIPKIEIYHIRCSFLLSGIAPCIFQCNHIVNKYWDMTSVARMQYRTHA